MQYIRQSTASQEISLGYFLDSTDGNTEETGLTIANTDIKLRKGGTTTLANKNSGGGTHISNGVYSAVLDATDSNTLGMLEIFVHVAGALAVKNTYMVLPAASYDAIVVNGLNDIAATAVVSSGAITTSGGAVSSVTLTATTTALTNVINSSSVVASVSGSVDSVTGDTKQTADHTAAIADIPTVAEFNARTILAASYFDPAADTVANVTLCATTTTVTNGVTVTTNNDKTGYSLTQSFPSNFSSMVISGAGSVDSLLQGYLNTLITETSAGRVAGNFDVFYDNANAQTTQTVDDVGGGGGGGTDWNSGEREEIRGRLGITGTTASGGNTPTLSVLVATDIVTSGAISTDSGVVKSDPLYHGAIHVDSIGGSSGTVVNTNGTERNPVAGWADVLTLSASTGINTVKVAPGSSLALSGATTGKLIKGSGWTLALASQNTDNTTIQGAFVSGITINTSLVIFATCQLAGVTSGPMQAIEGCYISGNYTATTSGPYGFDKIRTVEASSAAFDFNSINGCDATFRQFSGKMDIDNLGTGTSQSLDVEGQGKIKLESTCIGGSFVFDGNFRITDNSVTTTVNKSDYTARLQDIEVDTGTTLANQISGLNDVAATDIVSSGAITTSGGAVSNVTTTATNTDMVAEAPTAVQNRQEMDSNSTQLADIVEDTGTTLPGLIDDLAVKKNATFSNFEFLMVLTSDHVTPATGLTVAGQRSIDGGAFATVTGTIAEVSNGIYQFDAVAADTNGDFITWRFSSATADDTFVSFKTVA